MELILLKNVDKLGHKGDVITVRDGFARNFLIPRNLGLAATRANQEFVKEQKVRSEKRQAKARETATLKAKELKDLTITLEAAAGDQGKLFGSITAEDIRQALANQGCAVDKKNIQLKDPIRILGTHTVAVELYSQVKVSVTIEVVRKS